MKSTTKAATDVMATLDGLDDYNLPPEEYMNRRFGKGAWRFDPYCDCYIVPMGGDSRSGRSFVIVERDLTASTVNVGATQIN